MEQLTTTLEWVAIIAGVAVGVWFVWEVGAAVREEFFSAAPSGPQEE